MPRMKSRVAHTYGGRRLEVGQEFEADERLVRTLIATGRAGVVLSPPRLRELGGGRPPRPRGH